MTHKEKKHFVNDSLKELFPEYDFYVDRDMLDFAFHRLRQKSKTEDCQEEERGNK